MYIYRVCFFRFNGTCLTVVVQIRVCRWRSKGGAIGAVHPGRHFQGGRKIDAIPKNLGKIEVPKKVVKNFLGMRQKGLEGRQT